MLTPADVVLATVACAWQRAYIVPHFWASGSDRAASSERDTALEGHGGPDRPRESATACSVVFASSLRHRSVTSRRQLTNSF